MEFTEATTAKARNWFLTINNPESNELPQHPAEVYAVWQKEKVATEHLQCCICLSQQVAFSTIKKLYPRAHIQRTKMLPKAIEYCKKEESRVDGPWERGTPPKQGERTDLKRKIEEIQAGLQVDDICINDPVLYHQYGRTLREAEAILMRRKFRTEMTKGIWYTGPTAAGKSHKVFEGYSPETHYVKNINEDWWDGYRQQPIVVLNEFRGQIPLSELLDLIDKWPKTVKWRNRESVPFTSSTVLIASIFPPEEVYKRSVARGEAWGQFLRRVEVIKLPGRILQEASPIEEPVQEASPDPKEAIYDSDDEPCD
jgi:hypothetical protein